MSSARRKRLLPHLIEDVNEGGQNVAEGLSRSGLGDSDEVQAGERHRPALGLDGGRVVEALPHEVGHDLLREAALLKLEYGVGDVVPLHDGDLVLVAVLPDNAGASALDCPGRLVKVLLEGRQSVLVPVDGGQAPAGIVVLSPTPVPVRTAAAAPAAVPAAPLPLAAVRSIAARSVASVVSRAIATAVPVPPRATISVSIHAFYISKMMPKSENVNYFKQ